MLYHIMQKKAEKFDAICADLNQRREAISMIKNGYKDRAERLTNPEPKKGVTGSSSQDIIRLARILYQHSFNYAQQYDGNVSPYAMAGVPLLFSALRALLVELNANILGNSDGSDINLEYLTRPNEKSILNERYNISPTLMHYFSLLYEVRNEMIHPVHVGIGTTHNTPDYLLELRKMELLQSTGKTNSDYIWISQLQSHKLFGWGFSIIQQVAMAVLEKHQLDEFLRTGLLQSYHIGEKTFV